jgi:formyltetrahydrofolate synthetase
VVCVNKRNTDTDEELQLVVKKADEYGAKGVISTHWENGGKGACDLANAVIAASEQRQQFK